MNHDTLDMSDITSSEQKTNHSTITPSSSPVSFKYNNQISRIRNERHKIGLENKNLKKNTKLWTSRWNKIEYANNKPSFFITACLMQKRERERWRRKQNIRNINTRKTIYVGEKYRKKSLQKNRLKTSARLGKHKKNF